MPAFFLTAIFWLVLTCSFQQLRAIQLIFPNFLGSFLTFGRVDAAAEACFLYGWGSCVVLGWGLRFSNGANFFQRENLFVFFWNLAVAIGVGLILAGEVVLAPILPPGITLFLFFLAIFLCIEVCWSCLQTHTIASSWLFASFFFLPWLLLTAGSLLQEGLLKGAARLPVEAWFHEGFVWLCLGGSALAFAYYLISKVLDTDFVEQRLTSIGFWLYFCGGSLAALRAIAGGPIPAWISAAGISANLLLWVSTVIIWRNLCGTLKRFFIALESNPALRFTLLGANAFVLCSVQAIVLYSKTGAAYFQFTDFAYSQLILTRYGFLTSIFCAVLYYFLPRILLCEWPKPRAILWHFHLHRIGLTLVVISLAIGGFVQSVLLDNATTPFSASYIGALPWRCIAAIGWCFLLVAQIVFAAHVLWLCRAPRRVSRI